MTPARRFFLFLHIVTSLVAFLAVASGVVVLYWKVPAVRSIDKLKTWHGSVGAAVLLALILIAVNSCICFPNRKSTKRSFGWTLLHKIAGVLVVLAAGYVSYIGIGTYEDLIGASQDTLYIGAYGGCTGLLLFLYFILLFIPARDPSRLVLLAKDFDMVSASKGNKTKRKSWPPADISWPSSHRAMLAAGNFEQLPKLGTSAPSPPSVTTRVPSPHCPSPGASTSDVKDVKQIQPDLETGSGVSNSTGEQQPNSSQESTSKNRGKGSPVAPTMTPLSETSNTDFDVGPILPKGETMKNGKNPESSSQATTSTRETVSAVLVDSGEIRRLPNVHSYTSITDSEGSRPGTVNKQMRPKPSELESVDFPAAPPRKPRHPGDNTVVF